MDLFATHLLVNDWIMEAGNKIRHSFGESITVDTKTSRNDLVTNVDKEIEQFLISKIREQFPTHKIMGEEGFGDELTSMDGYVWLIDPIDGTLNFVKRQEDFGIMVALYKDGVGLLGYIYDVMRDRFVYGIKDYGAYCNGRRLSKPEVHSIGDSSINVNGFMLLEANEKEASMIRKAMVTRTYGASSIEHIQVVLGKSVAYVSTLLAPWDIAPGMVIAKELDLHYSTVDGKEVDFLVPNKKTTGVICSKEIAEEIIAAFK